MRHAGSGRETSEQLEQGRPDLVLLDVMLPDESGFEICRRLRRDSTVPVLFLSARDSDADKIRGLGLGGDDYIVKSATPAEVVARVKAVLRRASPAGGLQSASLRRARGRPGRARGQLRGAAGRADGTRVRAAARPRRASAAGVQPRPAVRARLGLVRRPERGRGLHRPPAPEDRARPGQTALHRHRLGSRLPPRSGQQMRRPPIRIRTFLLGTVLVLLLAADADRRRSLGDRARSPAGRHPAAAEHTRSPTSPPIAPRCKEPAVRSRGSRACSTGSICSPRSSSPRRPAGEEPALPQPDPRPGSGPAEARGSPAGRVRPARRPRTSRPARARPGSPSAGWSLSGRESRRPLWSPTSTTGPPPGPRGRSSRSSAESSSCWPGSRSRSGSPVAGWSLHSQG